MSDNSVSLQYILQEFSNVAEGTFKVDHLVKLCPCLKFSSSFYGIAFRSSSA